MKLLVSHGPHLRAPGNVRSIMTDVLIALLPVSVMAVYVFGTSALILMVVSTLVAMLTDAFMLHGKKSLSYVLHPDKLFGDGSAAVTGLILAHIVTPTLPIWMMIIGSVLAILIGKQVFGGLGQNIFNPALVGRAILLASWPLAMSNYISVDGVSGATPLVTNSSSYRELFLGLTGGSLAETSVLAILIGACYLFYRGHIGWRIPISYLASAAILSLALGVDPVYAMFAGGLAYAAFFMATDMVTTPVTPRGRIVFGLGCGIITVVIREIGTLPEGVMYSILLMNAATPIIDRLTRPKVWGGEISA